MEQATKVQKEPDFKMELESLQSEVRRTNELTQMIASKLVILKGFSPFVPSDERKNEDGVVGAIRKERYELETTNIVLVNCVNHLEDLVG
jgi:hypothetical protein